jgi:Tfp pilus assembly protein PilX
MTDMKAQSMKRRRACRAESESGIALITVLFLLIIMTILGLTMVASINSDMMINGYYGNSRAAYYAADSGMNVARQYLSNQLQLQASTTKCLGWGPNALPGCTADPLTPNAATAAALANLHSTFGGFSSGQLNVANSNIPNGSASAVSSWPSSFIIQDSATCQSNISNAPGSPVIQQNNINGTVLNTRYTYTFNYVLCSTGTGASSATQRAAVKELGTLILDIKAQDTHPPTFAGFGQFVNNQNACPGSYLTPGTYTGPNYTNGAWTLGNTGPYIFTGALTQSQPDIYYYGKNGCTGSTSSTMPGINITLQQGLQLNAPVIATPTDSFSQAWAVLDGLGSGEGSNAPTSANLNGVLKNVSATAYPTAGNATGVYLPYYRNTTTGQYNLGYLDSHGVAQPSGGIYVQGSASVVLSATTDISANPTQTYTITQGSTVTTIVTNPATNTTTFSSGGTTQTINGIPENLASSPGTETPGTLLYVNGTITGLSGPANPSDRSTCASNGSCTDTVGTGNTNPYPAIQNNNMVTVAGSGDINITGNLLYANEPVTRNTADTLLTQQTTSPASNTQVLGVFTANGSIILNSPYSDNNLETDGSLAAIGSSSACGTSTCGFKTSNTINTWNNVGGQIQSNEFVCSITTANTYYDQRFSAWNNFYPPWFPSTSTSGTNYTAQSPVLTPTQQRTSWAWIAAQ